MNAKCVFYIKSENYFFTFHPPRTQLDERDESASTQNKDKHFNEQQFMNNSRPDAIKIYSCTKKFIYIFSLSRPCNEWHFQLNLKAIFLSFIQFHHGHGTNGNFEDTKFKSNHNWIQITTLVSLLSCIKWKKNLNFHTFSSSSDNLNVQFWPHFQPVLLIQSEMSQESKHIYTRNLLKFKELTSYMIYVSAILLFHSHKLNIEWIK